MGESPDRHVTMEPVSDGAGATPGATFSLVYLMPLVYRPLKVNFAGRFLRLSARCHGFIFTHSGGRQLDVRIGSFRFYAEPLRASGVGRLAAWLRGQVIRPWILLRRQRVDMVIAYDPYASGLAGVILAKVLRTHLIIELNGDYQSQEPASKWPRGPIMRLSLRLCLRAAQAVRVLNDDQEAFVRARNPGKAVYRFPDFAATDYFAALPTYQGDYLLSVGYPFALKGVDVLIRAFRRVLLDHPAARLRIMGHCSEAQLRDYRAMAGEDPRIEFLKPGWVEDVGEQVRGCLALVNAARSEAMGRVHLEAMACRKPVVATRTNGGRDCVEDLRTGLLCEIGDVEDLTRCLRFILDHPDRAREMGERGFDRLGRMFSEEQHVFAFLRMVDEMIADKGEVTSRGGA